MRSQSEGKPKDDNQSGGYDSRCRRGRLCVTPKKLKTVQQARGPTKGIINGSIRKNGVMTCLLLVLA